MKPWDLMAKNLDQTKIMEINWLVSHNQNQQIAKSNKTKTQSKIQRKKQRKTRRRNKWRNHLKAQRICCRMWWVSSSTLVRTKNRRNCHCTSLNVHFHKISKRSSLTLQSREPTRSEEFHWRRGILSSTDSSLSQLSTSRMRARSKRNLTSFSYLTIRV